MKFQVPFFILLIISVLLLSCSPGADKFKTPVVEEKDTVVKENFETGKVIDQVVCKNDTSQSFAMYLPENYSTGKKFPIIIACDPHGTGNLPVSFYKDLAEKYNYVIIGSNNLKNGISWEETEKMAKQLLADAVSRLSINTERIYLLGFSGGARIANAITITNGSIAGVICCGAIAPAGNVPIYRNNYTLIGIIGTEDFNYIEMRKYDMVDIAGHNIKHGLIIFDGKHEWPAKEVMDEAFWWQELNEMRKLKILRNYSLIAKELQPKLKQLKTYNDNNQAFEAYQLCRKTINFYDGLADLEDFYASYKSLRSNADIDRALKTEESMWRQEEKLKANFMQAFQKENFSWWQRETGRLNRKIGSEKNREQLLIYKRTLNYLSLVAYMQANGALQQNNINAAEHFTKIYVLVDPSNSEAHYLMANVHARKGKTKEALNSLNTAIKNGFADVSRLERDSAFDEIKKGGEFKDILKKVIDKKQGK